MTRSLVHRTARPLTAALLCLASLGVLLAAAPASPAAAATGSRYYGNYCLVNSPAWSVDNGVGSESCVTRGVFVPNRYVDLTPSSFDYRADGLSSRNHWRVLQYYDGAWRTTHSGTCTNPHGRNHSAVCSTVRIGRANRNGTFIAGRVALQVQACAFDTPTATLSRCTSWQTKFNSTWSGT